MKTTKTLGVQFILRNNKKESDLALIYLRITVNGHRSEVSLKRSIKNLDWNPARECMKNGTPEFEQINKLIDETRFKIHESYQELKMMKKPINIDSLKNLFMGEEVLEHTLCSLIDYHNTNMKGVLAQGTLKNYFTTKKYIQLFLAKRFKVKDKLLNELNFQFISEFEFFLRNGKPLDDFNPLGNNGIMKHMERLKKISKFGVNLDWVNKDPFERFKLRFQKTERDFLTTEELIRIENFNFSNGQQRVRDMFIFSCYTGLAYIDLINLNKSNICLGMDGEYWIKTIRQKTDVSVRVPLLPKALEIIENYKDDPVVSNLSGVLPVLSNQKVNQNLKKIAKACNIEKDITFHLARHTFATTVTLTNGVPLETVSKMLGHTKLVTTQVYVHVLEKKISDDMKLLKDKFSQTKLNNK